ncbi:MAG: FAD-binding oxidoreductase, partial [Methylotenera sp.]|nr:FAD-binding oxidoreductase [Methylotenera sp.]
MNTASELKLTQNSYYVASANQTLNYPTLEDNIDTDVCVVGGGFAGLSAAIELADRGYKVVILEAHHIGFGASGRNGGQLIAGLACDQDVIEKALGIEAAKQIWSMSLEALSLVHERVKRFEIQCDLTAGFMGVTVNANKTNKLNAWLDDMAQRYAYEVKRITPDEITTWINSPRYHSGYYDPNGGHIHPLNYCLGLAKGAASLGVQIFTNSAVTAMQQGDTAVLHTEKGTVKAKFVVLAGNMYLPEISPKLAPRLNKRIMPVGTSIIGTEPINPTLASTLIPNNAAVCDTNFVLD